MFMYYWLICAVIAQNKDPQIEALLDIYNSLNGEYWEPHKWNTTQITNGNFCSLHGITCFINTSFIESINLSKNNLFGLIPPSICNVTNLTNLVLATNNIYGNIPRCIDQLKVLKILILNSNNLSGQIPSSIGNIGTLQSLLVHNNTIHGTIPNTLCNLSKLQKLSLSKNPSLSGTILPCIGNKMKHLKNFKMAYNNLTGSIPTSICKLSSLMTFDISYNSLNGIIPECIGNLSKLHSLTLTSNKLTGPIPNSICKLHNVLNVFLLNNEINGSIPDCINNMTKLATINLGHNNIEGTIPFHLNNLQNLVNLELANNSITGSLPDSICELKKRLKSITIYNNSINGAIPSCIGQIKHLHDFIVYNNSISGTIPNEICDLQNIMSIQVDRNKLSGNIPNCEYLAHLEAFIADINYLNGTIPTAICNWTVLDTLNLGFNYLIGTVPECLQRKQSLISLLLNRNRLHGSIKYYPPNIIRLLLSNNYFSGSLPQIQATKLQYLWLHNNSFNTNISELLQYIAKNNNLKEVVLHENEFYTDNIEYLLHDLFKQETLNVLSIFKNVNIHGSFPNMHPNDTNIFYQTSLNYFLAHDCDLYGSIPDDIVFSNVRKFTMQNNRLSCDIPEYLTNVYESTKNLLLPSNRFALISNSVPSWLVSPFITAKALYTSYSDKIQDDVLLAVAIIIAILGIVLKCYFYVVNELNDSNHNNNYQYNTFLQNIKNIHKHLISFPLLIISIMLIVIYSMNSTYFLCLPLIHKISLTYYENNNNMFSAFILIILAMLCQVIYLKSINSLSKYSNINYDDNLIRELIINQDYNENNDDNTNINIEPYNHFKSCCLFFCYLLLYLIFVGFTIFYALIQSLPENNDFHFDDITIECMIHSLSVILLINNVYVIPHLIDTGYQILKKTNKFSEYFIINRRARIIVYFRSFTTIFMPLCASILLLNDCGRFWTIAWESCDAEQKHIFEWSFMVNFVTHKKTVNTKIPILHSDDICSSFNLNGFQNINWNKCIRSFFNAWASVILLKHLLMIITPPFIIFIQILYQKLRRKNINEIKVDMEYAMIVNKLESMIFWSIVEPIIIPITFISLLSNFYFYKLAMNKLKWKLYPFNYKIKIPIKLLWIGVTFQHLLFIFYIYFTFNDNTNNIIKTVSLFAFILCVCIINICFYSMILLNKCKK